jgi:hypothetical protein
MKYPMRACTLFVGTFVFAAALHASDSCGEEVKLLLAPVQAQSAVASLNVSGPERSQIYFYDTPQLDLLAKGLILRIRQGADNDLTVKLRPASEQQFSARAAGNKNFKCEGEVIDGAESPSYSTKKKFDASSVPQTGEELLASLSKGQRELLKASGIMVDWAHVRRIAEIQSSSWSVPAQTPQLDKLSLELWEWPEGKSLELSAKVSADEGSATFVELKNVAKRNHIDLSPDQHSKTSTALRSITK